MYFSNWKKYKDNHQISQSLLWEYDLTKFDWGKMKTIVVQRVIERGDEKDIYAAINLYGGMNEFIQILKEVPRLNPIDMNFVCRVFNIKKEDLRCYKRTLLREQLFNS